MIDKLIRKWIKKWLLKEQLNSCLKANLCIMCKYGNNVAGCSIRQVREKIEDTENQPQIIPSVASGQYLDRLATMQGIERPEGMNDNNFRIYIMKEIQGGKEVAENEGRRKELW